LVTATLIVGRKKLTLPTSHLRVEDRKREREIERSDSLDLRFSGRNQGVRSRSIRGRDGK
jgi:hypothetical protein